LFVRSIIHSLIHNVKLNRCLSQLRVTTSHGKAPSYRLRLTSFSVPVSDHQPPTTNHQPAATQQQFSDDVITGGANNPDLLAIRPEFGTEFGSVHASSFIQLSFSRQHPSIDQSIRFNITTVQLPVCV
jgi:hypothetical protein